MLIKINAEKTEVLHTLIAAWFPLARAEAPTVGQTNTQNEIANEITATLSEHSQVLQTSCRDCAHMDICRTRVGVDALAGSGMLDDEFWQHVWCLVACNCNHFRSKENET